MNEQKSIKRIILILFIGMSFLCVAQDTKQSIASTVTFNQKLATDYYLKQDYASAIYFSGMALNGIETYKKKFGIDSMYYFLNYVSFMSLGDNYFKSGDYNTSIKNYEMGLTVQLRNQQPFMIYRFYWGLGRNYNMLGDLLRAQSYIEKAIQSLADTNDIPTLINKGTYLNELSIIDKKNNQPQNQYDRLQEARKLYQLLLKKIPDGNQLRGLAARGLVTSSNNLCYLLIKDSVLEAKNIALESLKYFDIHPQPEQYYFTFDNLVSIALKLGDTLGAKVYMERAANISNLPEYKKISFITKAKYYQQVNNYSFSIESYMQALPLTKGTSLEPVIQSEIAYDYGELADYQRSLNHYEEAIDLLTKMRTQQFNLIGEETKAYEGAILSSFRTNDDERAYNLLLTYKSFNLNSLMLTLNKDAFIPDSINIKIKNIEKGITKVRISNIDQKEKDIELGLLVAEFLDDIKGLGQTDGKIRAKNLMTVIDTNEILLDFFATGDVVICFAVEYDGVTAFELGYKDKLDSLIAAFQSDFIVPSSQYFYRNDIHAERIAKRKFPEISSRLFKFLLGQISERIILKDKKLVVLSSGNIGFIPFELLVTNDTLKAYSDYDYLFRSTDISYYPSAITLYLARQKLKTSVVFEQDFLGVGDPLFPTHESISEYTLNKKGNYVMRGPSEIATTIAASKIEIEEIAKKFPSSRRTILLRQNASEEKLKSLHLSSYKNIHFSTHGFVNTSIPELSSLKLVEDNDTLEDGYLCAFELLRLQPNSDLVCLSACETGLGKVDDREGMIGFTNYLLMAGTKSTILSLWPVADKPTSVFFTTFYDNILKGSVSKSESLKQVKNKFLADKGLAHPFLWAPFILCGERK